MYAKILHRIKNMGFRKKITGISLAISLIPVILLGIFSYGRCAVSCWNGNPWRCGKRSARKRII